jgi:ferric-dicitrate binding protein FerR (iron transport regulator)
MSDLLEKLPVPIGNSLRRAAAIATRFPYARTLGIGLLLLLAVGLFWWVSGEAGWRMDTRIETKAGEQEKVVLPDGSQVTLNAGTSLRYDKAGWNSDRKVVLSGEAYFKASKGARFLVETRQGDVACVGTQFNVFAREKELEVKCLEGKVQVINPDESERVLLAAKEQVSVLGGRMQHRRKLTYYPKWFKGESHFREATLGRVFDELERQFGITVLADSLRGRPFSGKFSNKDLRQALQSVCRGEKLNYAVQGDSVFIRQ